MDKTVTATEFKAKCLKILDELGPQGIVVTKRPGLCMSGTAKSKVLYRFARFRRST